MNFGLAMTLGFIIFMAAVVVAIIGVMIYMDSSGVPEASPTSMTASTTSTSTTSSTTTLFTPLTEPTETTSTSTTLSLKPLAITYSPAKLYLHETATLRVTSEGEPQTGASIYLDGRPAILSNNGDDQLTSLDAGYHEVTAYKEGYSNATANFTVDKSTYSHSPAIRLGLTPEERLGAISDGKADLRFYENPGCTQCITVLNYLHKIVDKNRQCMVFERLNVWNPSANKEAQELFGKNTVLSFPLIVVDGSKGTFKTQGVVSPDAIRDMIGRASGCSVQ
jgi:hypothetical protein